MVTLFQHIKYAFFIIFSFTFLITKGTFASKREASPSVLASHSHLELQSAAADTGPTAVPASRTSPGGGGNFG